MKTIIAEHYEELCKLSANIGKEQIQAKKDAVLGLATGSTPVGLYKQLISDYQAGEIDFSKVLHLIWMNTLVFLRLIRKVITILCK